MQHLEDAFDRMDIEALSLLFFKLLQALTRDRHLAKDNWQQALRREWEWRADEATPLVLGTDDEPLDWSSLTLDSQLDTLHALCEWQLERPDRLRRLVGTDGDAVSWRVDPAGWDREGNTYWLFDDNRLWVQRAPPRPRKRKAPPPKKPVKKRAAPPPRRGGRRSSRLSRDAEWEPVPAEILKPEDVFDSDSELSNPPSEEEPEEFIEFETQCVSLDDWKRFLERFASSKHPDERVLHTYLAKEVYPRVEEVLLAEQRKQALEEAMQHRKRSSRIAMKESEREEREREINEVRAQREAAAAALAEERARLAREEAERSARRSREERLRDREERILARERRFQERSRSHTPHLAGERDTTTAATNPRSDSDWYLHCEVCGANAQSPPGEENVVACERCGVWQHTDCWDRRDHEQGRPPRDWDRVDFHCGTCAALSSEPEPLAPHAPLMPERTAEPLMPQKGADITSVPQQVPSETGPQGHTSNLPPNEPTGMPAPSLATSAPPAPANMAPEPAQPHTPVAPDSVPNAHPTVPSAASQPGMHTQPTQAGHVAERPRCETPTAPPPQPWGSPDTMAHHPSPLGGDARFPKSVPFSPRGGSRVMSPPGSFPLRRNTMPSPLSRAVNPSTSVPSMDLDADAPSPSHHP